MGELLNPIKVYKEKWTELKPNEFKDVRFGENVSQKTEVFLSRTDDFLIVKFTCKNDPFVANNYLKTDNLPLYNQEVFELFISIGNETPSTYLEFEINPNNAIWIGKINNPTLKGDSLSAEMIDPKQSGIKHEVKVQKNSWSGQFSIPISLIGGFSKTYRFNLYRIVALKKQENKDWICDIENCSFQGLYPTQSGEKPAFHRPEYFGYLEFE